MTAKREPGRVPNEVLDYFRAKGIRPAFDSLDVWREEHQAAFAVAKATETDIIEALKHAVDAALTNGVPFEQFRRDISPILADLGWWGRQDRVDPLTGETKEVQLGSPTRLRLILETNSRVARAAGQWERMDRAKRALPFLRYRLGASEKHRPEHVVFDGKILRMDDPFWDTHMPPNGYNCKCWVEQLSRSRATELGGESESPKLEFVEMTNPRTGKTVRSPRGIDPTFAYNPGKNRLQGLRAAGIL